MNRLSVVPARPDDCARLAKTLRPEDAAELRAASGLEPLPGLLHGYNASDESYVALCAHEPIAMYGVVRLGPGVGAPWMLGSALLRRHWFEFARRSRDEFDRIRAPYARLTNYIDDRNDVHKRWITWLGLEMVELVPNYGHEGRPFWRFEYSV